MYFAMLERVNDHKKIYYENLNGNYNIVSLVGHDPTTSCMYRTFAHALYQLSYRLSCAAIGVTRFFNRGHTPRLKFVFSLQFFLSIGMVGFLPTATLVLPKSI